MTDKEIIKALECCIGCDCTDCPCNTREGCKDIDYEAMLDLINRQQARIEKRESDFKSMQECARYFENKYETAKSEAIKEFEEMLREFKAYVGNSQGVYITDEDIDNLVKEMVGEDK